MIRQAAERWLVVLMILFSLALSGLTVWSVAGQARALQARERSDLEAAAFTVATERSAALRADVERACDAAARAWEFGGADELDAWIASRHEWPLAATVRATGMVVVFPRPPLSEPFPQAPNPLPPGATPTTTAAAESLSGRDLLALLRDFQTLATNPDPLTRAGALLAMATVEQQLGQPLAAARLFGDAAHLLRSTPRLARYAFRAELARVDTLLAAADYDRAREVYAGLLRGLRNDHPGRLSPAETARLAEQWRQLGIEPEDPLAALRDELRQRAERRSQRAAVLERIDVQEGAGVRFSTAVTAADERVVVAKREIAPGVVLQLLAPQLSLLERYWPAPTADAYAWRLMPSAAAGLVLAQLGPEFGGAVLEPSLTAAAGLRAHAHRQIAIVAATAIGTTGAWALVIVMLMRVVTRQRELARVQGRFVADVSHELKTPLALIRLLAETLAEQRVRNPDRVQSYHETIIREAERLSVLVDNILDLGRIESGRKTYTFGECEPAAIARQAWTLFEPQFAEAGFQTELDLAPQLPAIRADAQALQQVLVNLLQNAYRYSRENKFVRLRVWREGFIVIFSVEDHGIGMGRNELKRLGESFFRAEDARTVQTRGAGLGLAIVNHIVTAHHGKIDVQSRPGAGSTFTVWIPFDPDRPAPLRPPARIGAGA